MNKWNILREFIEKKIKIHENDFNTIHFKVIYTIVFHEMKYLEDQEYSKQLEEAGY